VSAPPASRTAGGGQRRRRTVRRAAIISAALAAPALAFVLSDIPPSLLAVDDPPQRADAALVMTGDPGYERTKEACRLVRQGTARLLVLTGGEPWPGDSAASLRDVAVTQGIPPERIRLESRSRDTRESLVDVEPILRAEGVRSVILVTSPSHQRRASLLARRALPGIRIINHPVRLAPWPPKQAWWRAAATRRVVLREYAKLLYSGLRGWL
jgi:uncharacterized SAM-binding protein YcdF (DUF218 family)